MGDSTLIIVIGDDIKFSSSIQNLINEKVLYDTYIGSPSHSLDIFIKEYRYHQQKSLLKEIINFQAHYPNSYFFLLCLNKIHGQVSSEKEQKLRGENVEATAITC